MAKAPLLAALAALSIALAGCASSAPTPAPTPTPTSASTPVASTTAPAAPAPARPRLGTFGFDGTGMSSSTAPGASFFGFANGAWVATAAIPADRSSYGMFARLDDESNEQTRAIIDEVAKVQSPVGTDAQRVGDFYASFMDEAAIEAAGAKPIEAELAALRALKDKKELARTFARMGRELTSTPFGWYINNDDKEPTKYVPIFVQAGLGLPDRDYYVGKDAKFVELRDKYKAHAARMLTLAGVPEADAKKKAAAIYELEKKMAEVHWTRVDSRDADKTYNKWQRKDFDKKAPGFDWASFFDAAGMGAQAEFVVAQPSAYTGMAKLVGKEPLAVWQDYLVLRHVKSAAPLLAKAFADENFDFDERTVNGQPEMKARWKRGVEMVNGSLGEAVGKLYVEKHFPPQAKAAADALVQNVIVAMGDRLDKLAWMAPETKAKARTKLAAFTPKIGYPEKWRDYGALEVKRGDAYGNAQRAARFESDRNLAKLGKPIDRGEWFMPPMQVNAYANPVMNEIVFPAAILQPPFFDANADPAINYGGIGAVIGHEISHHFDDQGRKYDASGKLTDWWTADDVKRFQILADQLVAQYAQYEPLPGQKVNGQLTLGENIADLAGLTVAYDAYQRSLGGKPAPVIDGFSGDQRFFLGWAQVWRTKYREENLRKRLLTDPHSPAEFRANVVRNLDPWYGAFAPKAGETLHLAPEGRVRIW